MKAVRTHMTPAQFRSVASQIAGPHWRTHLGPMIGKCRTQVWEYANGKRPVPKSVEKLMLLQRDAATPAPGPGS